MNAMDLNCSYSCKEIGHCSFAQTRTVKQTDNFPKAHPARVSPLFNTPETVSDSSVNYLVHYNYGYSGEKLSRRTADNDIGLTGPCAIQLCLSTLGHWL